MGNTLESKNTDKKSLVTKEHEEKIKQQLWDALTEDQRWRLVCRIEAWDIPNEFGNRDVYSIKISLHSAQMGM